MRGVDLATPSGLTGGEAKTFGFPFDSHVQTSSDTPQSGVPELVEMRGVEPLASAMRMPRSSQLSYIPKFALIFYHSGLRFLCYNCLYGA